MHPRGEFSVYQFFKDGSQEDVVRFTDAETAVRISHGLTTSVGGRLGTTVRVIITDGGDCTAFEWLYGKGVVFPPLEKSSK